MKEKLQITGKQQKSQKSLVQMLSENTEKT